MHRRASSATNQAGNPDYRDGSSGSASRAAHRIAPRLEAVTTTPAPRGPFYKYVMILAQPDVEARPSYRNPRFYCISFSLCFPLMREAACSCLSPPGAGGNGSKRRWIPSSATGGITVSDYSWFCHGEVNPIDPSV